MYVHLPPLRTAELMGNFYLGSLKVGGDVSDFYK